MGIRSEGEPLEEVEFDCFPDEWIFGLLQENLMGEAGKLFEGEGLQVFFGEVVLGDVAVDDGG